MSQEHEQFIAFLNECATSIRSVMIDLLGGVAEGAVREAQAERFEAPKLSAMIAEIKEMTMRIEEGNPVGEGRSAHVLTPAAAYFAFSAPFDAGDEFIPSETWSFAQYDRPKKNRQARRAIITKVKMKPKVAL
jgi:hypothetical protein